MKTSTNRGHRCARQALARLAEAELFRQFQYLTVPLWVTEDAELRALADWRSFCSGWRGWEGSTGE